MWLIRLWESISVTAGAFLIGLAVRNTLRGLASVSWPQTQGRIVNSFVLVDKSDDAGEAFVPQVEFDYVVGGKTYRGKRIQYGRIGNSRRRQAEKVIAPFPLGGQVQVFFDPRKPADAVLAAGVSWGNLVIGLSGIAFVAGAYAMQVSVR